MNPSASGWIKKLLKELSNNNALAPQELETFYKTLKFSGFIYGNNIDIVGNLIKNDDYSRDELCKINLVIAFYTIHASCQSSEDFTESVLEFYKAVNTYKTTFIQELLGQKNSSELLERIINKRVHIDDNIITKNFNYFITNALLFVDVLAYQRYLTIHNISEPYLKHLEAAIEVVMIKVLGSKADKSKYEDSFIKLIEASLRYQDNTVLTYNEVVMYFNTPLSKYYITDLVCMALWSDKVIDKDEQQFLKQFGKDLNLNPQTIAASIEHLNQFYETNKDKIALLNSKNMVHSFYDNSSKMVRKLIKRNSKRLLKELKESKELMVLLTKSTTRPLSEEEQKKVQDQLLDIFKSIPSLAIFMLPGGMLILPIFIKFIPKLLPSAFDDNRIEED